MEFFISAYPSKAILEHLEERPIVVLNNYSIMLLTYIAKFFLV